MVRARRVNGFVISPTMLVGLSPKIIYYCGSCGRQNSTRISMNAIRNGKPYACCSKCGETNNLGLTVSDQYLFR